MTGPPLLSLPIEITQHTILECHPNDVAAIARSCRCLHHIVYSPSDTHIWRSLFLSIFDDPRLRRACYVLGHTSSLKDILTTAQHMDYDWMGELQRRIAAMNLIKNKKRALSATTFQRRDAIEAFISVADTSSPFLSYDTSEELQHEPPKSKSLAWLYSTLEAADALNHTMWPLLHNTLFITMNQYPGRLELSARSRLHVYLGLTPSDRQPTSVSSSTSSSFAHSSLTNSATFTNHSTGAPADSHRYALRSLVASDDSQNQTSSSPDLSNSLPLTPKLHQSLRIEARAMVYDIRNYSEDSMYGPFLCEDPPLNSPQHTPRNWTVNWRHVEALMMVIAWNIEEDLGPETMIMLGRSVISPPIGLESLRPWNVPGLARHISTGSMSTFHSSDWAGVEGRWTRVVCFLDYRDFFHFNFSTPSGDAGLNTDIFEEEDFAEAMRVLHMELRITHVESEVTARPDASLPASSPSSADTLLSNSRPRIHLVGTSEGGTPNEATLRGFVEANPVTGDVRWWMVSAYGGEERWSSEGVQIGGGGSKTGVVGCWTGVHHAEGDPAGPYWMWKLE